MSFPEIEVLLPNRFSWDGIVLTISSILKRTKYPNYKITVMDNSQAPWNPKVQHERDLKGVDDDGCRIDYLRYQHKKGNIKLIEIKEQYKRYGHGENIKRLLDSCTAPYAMLLSSGTEAVNSNWLQYFLLMIQSNDKALGVSRINPEGQHFDVCYIAPRYVPNWMFLDMKKYSEIKTDEDWLLKRVSLTEYKYNEIFEEMPPLKNPEYDPPRVFLDTGWKLYETLNLGENPHGYEMLELPKRFVRNIETQMNDTFMLFFGGMDRNAHRPQIDFMVKRRKEIAERLGILGNE